MRVFLVFFNDLPTSLVFHDYLKGLCYCRSKNESFRKVFDTTINQPLQKFVKNGHDVNVTFGYVTDYDWIEPIMEKLSNNKWNSKELDSEESAHSPEELINTYLL